MPRKAPVLLIQPMQGEYTRSQIFQPGVELPLNLTSLSTYLERHGVPCEVLDLRIEEDPRESLFRVMEAVRPDWIGLSAYSSEIAVAIQIGDEIKRRSPDARVVIGGIHATAEPEATLREGRGFDYLVHGEGEKALLELVTAEARGVSPHSVAGVAYRDGDRVEINPRQSLIRNLDELPYTHRDGMDLARYLPSPGTGNFLRLPSTGIMASRGCPYNCYYCSKGVWGTTIRFRSVEHVLAEIEHCIERYGIRDFRFYDDALPLPQWDLEGFCERIVERGLDISWNCYSRVDLVRERTLRAMGRAGCYHVKYGIEFGTGASLKRANKRTTLEQARDAVRMTKQAGIECKANFIVGIPGETEEDCRETIRFAVELSPDLAAFYPFYPAPGSVFDRRLREEPGCAETLLPEADRQRLAREGYRRFYFRPGFVLQRSKRLLRYPVREARVLSSAVRMMGTFYLRRLVGARKARSDDSAPATIGSA